MLVLFIILGHTMGQIPVIKEFYIGLLNAKGYNTRFCVELFFILAGFFLYKRIIKTDSVFDLIKKTYFRLLPAFLFIFVLCDIFGGASTTDLPSVLTLTAGSGIVKQATGWGDWYVSTYFWCFCLYSGLFYFYRKQAVFGTLILIYTSLSIKFHGQYVFQGAYSNIIPCDVIRGLYAMGMGIIAALLSEKVEVVFNNNIFKKLFFGVCEIVCLIYVFNYVARGVNLSYFEVSAVFSILTVLFYNSAGFLSTWLNRADKICCVSRYVYPVFLCHILSMLILHAKGVDGIDPVAWLFIAFGSAIMLALIEYHLIELRLVPFIKNRIK